MTNTELLKDIINKSGLKYGFIAKEIGLSRYGLKKKIENESSFKADEIQKLCNVLHIESYEEREKIFFCLICRQIVYINY